jgi:hypothetical protein
MISHANGRFAVLERAPDALFKGQEPVLHLMGWCGGAPRCALTRTGRGRGGGLGKRFEKLDRAP